MFNRKMNRNFAVTTMAATAAVTAVAPAVSAAEDVSYPDVKPDTVPSHYEAIMELTKQGVLQGDVDGNFHPWNDVNRGQVAAMFVEALDLEIPNDLDKVLERYTDVDANSEYAEEIAAVTKEKIFYGQMDGKFQTWTELQRDQMATVLVQAFDLDQYDNGEDVEINLDKIGASHKDNVQTLANLGITKELEDYRPHENITRAAFATMFKLAQDVVKEYEAPLTSGFAGFVKGVDGALEDATVTVDGQTATTNEQGFYQLDDVTAGTHTVTIEAEGYETVKLEKQDVLENELSSLSYTFDKLIDTSKIEVSGVIVDADTSANVNDATVTLESYDDDQDTWETVATTRTTTGKYTLDQNAADPDFELGKEYRQTVSADGYKDFVQTVTLDEQEVENNLAGIQLEAIEAIDITGTVTGADEKAVENASISIKNENGDEVAKANTDDKGKYLVEDERLLSGTYNVVVDAGNFAKSYTEFTVEEGTNVTHDVQLKEGFTVNATIGTESLSDVFGENNTAADTAEYTLELMNGNTTIASKTISGEGSTDDATLDFELDRVASGDYTLKLSGDYVVTEVFDLTVNEDETFEARANPAGTLSGTIQKGGTAIQDVTTTVTLLDKSGEVVDTVETDDGTYKFTGLPQGDYSIEASATGYVDGSQEGEVTASKNEDTEGNDLKLDPVVTEGTASGFVREEGSLTALDGATVTYYDSEGEQVESVSVDSDGSYTTGNIEKGNYQVIVRGNGVETLSTTQMIEAGEDLSNVNYNLEDGGDASLEITAVDNEGNAVEIAKNGVTISDWFNAEGESEGTWDSTNDAAETVTLKDLSGGTYNLDVDFVSDEYVDVEGATATLAKSENGELEFAVEEVADQRDVNFRVVDENNSNLKGATVVVYNEDGTIKDVIDTNDKGTVADYKLVDGNYKLAVYQNDYVVAERDVTVDGTDVTVPVIQLTAIN